MSAFVSNMISFIPAKFTLRIYLFRYVFCQRKSSKTCYFSTVLTLLFLTMVSVSHIYFRQIARFHCVSLSHRGCLIWWNLTQFRSKFWKPAYRHQHVFCSLMKHAVSANQSVRYVETLLWLSLLYGSEVVGRRSHQVYQFFYSIYLQGEPIITRQSWWYL